MNALLLSLALLGAAPDGVESAQLTLAGVTYTATWDEGNRVYNLDNGYGSFFVDSRGVWHWDEDGAGGLPARSMHLGSDHHPFRTGSPFWAAEWPGIHEFGEGFVDEDVAGWNYDTDNYGTGSAWSTALQQWRGGDAPIAVSAPDNYAGGGYFQANGTEYHFEWNEAEERYDLYDANDGTGSEADGVFVAGEDGLWHLRLPLDGSYFDQSLDLPADRNPFYEESPAWLSLWPDFVPTDEWQAGTPSGWAFGGEGYGEGATWNASTGQWEGGNAPGGGGGPGDEAGELPTFGIDFGELFEALGIEEGKAQRAFLMLAMAIAGLWWLYDKIWLAPALAAQEAAAAATKAEQRQARAVWNDLTDDMRKAVVRSEGLTTLREKGIKPRRRDIPKEMR